MVPEILQRCHACGATIREQAFFCPECGKPLRTSAAAPVEKQPQSNARRASQITNQSSGSDEKASAGSKPSNTPAAVKDVPRTDRLGARERTRETLHRASTAARGAIEDNVKRVEKIHHVSTVMFEEAHYDPSLRFVLVALGLFVVFIILLVLSKVMG